ncbi:TonB-dependent receptor [Teredinibacter turnerae]|uniref:TonB-dependent receptor n=1 Tax=Teredinibacter turnerae TaxID=2426 RepID=UPI00040B6AF2|nr:TonB-dependent receptor [Teredinibacter turnerae]
MFKKNKLSAAVVGVLATSAIAAPTFAQDEAIEEVFVTGIRASMEAAMDVKRNSAGVVDAISAEDIGKFPDTNLAESLQRITGVSIKRTNGEGSEITVRGFGPDFNMVTLNGRTMPGAITYGGSSGADGTTRGGSARAFDFSNLASEAVRGVEVYKTGKASIATGGIGATVNIKTSRPLEDPGLSATVGVKALHDTTNRTGSDITPEVSGLVSWADDDAKFGASLSASYQERDSGYIGATVNQWNIGVWGQDDLYVRDRSAEEPGSHTEDPIFVNPPEVGQLYARPNDIRYAFSDTSRQRTNAQLTLQFAPNEKITGTLDYTFAQNSIEEFRGEVTNWVQNGSNLTYVEFDNSDVATPIIITEDYGNGWRDQGYEQQYRSQENTLDSVGLNIEFQATDNLSFVLDAHDSSMESLPTGPGGTGELSVALGAPVKTGKTLYFGGDLPYWTHNLDDCRHANLDRTDEPKGNNYLTNCNGVLDAGDVSSTVMRNWAASQVSDITQVKLDGTLEFDNGRFDFGVETRDMSSNTSAYNSNNAQVLGGWGADNPGEFPEGLLEEFDVVGEFDDFDTGDAPHVGFRADARELAEFLVSSPEYASVNPFIGLNNDGRNTRNTNNTVEEETTAIYFQFAQSGTLGNFETNTLLGLRYETTDVTSTSNVQPVGYLNWASDDDFSPVSVGASVSQSESGSYDSLLPNLDFDISFLDNLIGRFSFSKTIARPSFGNLAVAAGNFGLSGSTMNGAVPTATGSNPGLLPLESTNYDLSLEWYFSDSSYLSGGFWEKRVINFVGTGQEDRTFFDIRDQTAGPRAMAAAAALAELGEIADNANLHTMMVILADPTRFPNGKDDFTGEQTQISALGEGCAECDIQPNESDPLMVFRTSFPVNNREAKIHGFELAVQHFFGETGFGVMANYTFVDGDVEFDNLAPPTEQQFALLGLSDTANLVLMYENYGVQARLAYNWRDEYLNRTNYQSSNNPTYIEAYSQIDMNVSYDITDSISVFFEGINLTGADNREFARNEKQMYYLEDLGPRYALGARYSF